MHQGLAALVRASAHRKAVQPKRSPKYRPPVSRGMLWLTDLKTRGPVSRRLMNVTVSAEIAVPIEDFARRVAAAKTEVVLALLNEGLNCDVLKRSGGVLL